MQDFHQLNVWKKAHGLVLRVYKASNDLPASENFGLVLNLRRSAATIARSIAEGTGRDSDVEFAIELKKARAAGPRSRIQPSPQSRSRFPDSATP
jgi:hypothetical protein